MENLFEQIMKENYPNLAKEIDLQEVQEDQRVPKKLDPKRNIPRHIIIKLPKVKDKEKYPKSSKRKGDSLPTKEFPQGYQLISQNKPYRQEAAGKKYLNS